MFDLPKTELWYEIALLNELEYAHVVTLDEPVFDVECVMDWTEDVEVMV